MDATETSREKLYRAAVGPRADFYVPLFLKFDAAGTSGRSWNWPAFFVSFYWFLYRRMFGQWTLYCLLIPIAVALVAAILARLGVSPLVGDVLCLGYAFGLLPLTANHLYYRAIQQRIAAVRAKSRDVAAQVSALEALPHTSELAIVVAFTAVALLGLALGLIGASQ
jgi:Protein of unknown function (DUF2628)